VLRSSAAFLGATTVAPWILWVVEAKLRMKGNWQTVAELAFFRNNTENLQENILAFPLLFFLPQIHGKITEKGNI
jgi:hypothetical protein